MSIAAASSAAGVGAERVKGGSAVDDPGVEIARAHRRVGEEGAEERDVRVDAEHDGGAERGIQTFERLSAVGAMSDDLRDHRVVVAGDGRARLDRGVGRGRAGAVSRNSSSTPPVDGRNPRAGLSA